VSADDNGYVIYVTIQLLWFGHLRRRQFRSLALLIFRASISHIRSLSAVCFRPMRLVVAFMSGLLAALLEPVKFTWRHLLTWLQGLITGKLFALCSVPCLYMCLLALACVSCNREFILRDLTASRSFTCARAARAHTLAGRRRCRFTSTARSPRAAHTPNIYLYFIEPRRSV
jgi:hypothetical protein